MTFCLARCLPMTVLIVVFSSQMAWSQSKEFSHPISPVYEELLGNQIYLLWEELVQKKDQPFFIAGWKEAEAALASHILSAAKKRHNGELNHWQTGFVQDWEVGEDLPSS